MSQGEASARRARAIGRVLGTLDGALQVLGALCLAGLTALVLLQVVLRYVVGSVPAFTEEVARYAMIWMALTATAVGVRHGAHIRIDAAASAIGAVSPRLAVLHGAILDAITLAICLVLVWYGVDMVRFAAFQTSEGLRIPLSYPYVIVPVAFAVAALFAAARILTRSR
ncbi:MAG: hypothetical protein AcusKO_44280 [Acuticoccus sp.]